MTERDPRTRIVLSWLREDAHENAERMLLRALDEVDATPQRRSWWPARRSSEMSNLAKVLVATAAIVAVAFVGIRLLPGGQTGAVAYPSAASPSAPPPSASPSPLPSPTPEPTASPVAHSVTPFSPVGVDGEANPRAASVTFAFTAPPSWEPFDVLGVFADGNAPPAGAAVFFYRGAGLYSDPCRPAGNDAPADIPVGPSVDDFVTALVDHPSLDVTVPVDVTLAGYSGKYLDLAVPDDISKCDKYRPLDNHIYAQGPGQRWHMWVLDVDGVRVLVEADDYAGTSAERLAEERGIVDSLVITP
jgi:hypothetical protein